MSYLVTAFLTNAMPSTDEARAYLLDGALFDRRPTIDVRPDAMEICYDADKRPMILRTLQGQAADAARGEAIDLAQRGGRTDIEDEIAGSTVVMEWEVARSELDEDAWFALHLWQAWFLGRAGGWLYAPGDGLFDVELKRVIPVA